MAREIQIQIPKLIASGSTNRRRNCERVALDLSGRNNALFTYHFPDFPIIMTQLSQIMWLPLHKGCPQLQVAAFTRNQFNYDTHSSHRDYKPPPTYPLQADSPCDYYTSFWAMTIHWISSTRAPLKSCR